VNNDNLKTPDLIVGGGSAGLASACMLAKRDDVRVPKRQCPVRMWKRRVNREEQRQP
jgi:hypothetical protein